MTRKEEVLFVAFAGWDAAGAKSFGYPTFWVNRLNSPTDQLGFAPDGIGTNLDDLISFLNSYDDGRVIFNRAKAIREE